MTKGSLVTAGFSKISEKKSPILFNFEDLEYYKKESKYVAICASFYIEWNNESAVERDRILSLENAINNPGSDYIED